MASNALAAALATYGNGNKGGGRNPRNRRFNSATPGYQPGRTLHAPYENAPGSIRYGPLTSASPDYRPGRNRMGPWRGGGNPADIQDRRPGSSSW